MAKRKAVVASDSDEDFLETVKAPKRKAAPRKKKVKTETVEQAEPAVDGEVDEDDVEVKPKKKAPKGKAKEAAGEKRLAR
jgi:hypothetical protein